MGCAASPSDGRFGSIAEHRAAILAAAIPSRRAWISPRDAAGSVLAADVRARLDLPPFAASAMDGFAVRGSDLVPGSNSELPVVGDIPAGTAGPDLAPATAVRIMTGAPVPAGADVVVRVEDTDAPNRGPAPTRVRLTVPAADAAPGRHIRPQGCEVANGDVILESGAAIGPAALALALSCGVIELPVWDRPRIAVIATGAELRSTAERVDGGEIFESNSAMVAAVLRRAGAFVESTIVADDVEAFLAAVERLGRHADVVVTTGGVSAGAYEVVREAFTGKLSLPGAPPGSADAGEGRDEPSTAVVRFERIAMRPGGPQGLGHRSIDGRLVPIVCFPGTPSGALVSSYLFLVPLVTHLRGARPDRPASARWAATEPVRTGPDALIVPGRREGEGVRPCAGRHLTSFASAECLIEIAPHSEVGFGDPVLVHDIAS